QRFRSQLSIKDRVGWFVSGKGFRGGEFRQSLTGHPRSFELVLRFVESFAAHQRLRLCEEIGNQDFVVSTETVVTLRRREKIARDQLSALMNQLIKGMLPIGAGLTENNGAGIVIDRFAF